MIQVCNSNALEVEAKGLIQCYHCHNNSHEYTETHTFKKKQQQQPRAVMYKLNRLNWNYKNKCTEWKFRSGWKQWKCNKLSNKSRNDSLIEKNRAAFTQESKREDRSWYRESCFQVPGMRHTFKKLEEFGKNGIFYFGVPNRQGSKIMNC